MCVTTSQRARLLVSTGFVLIAIRSASLGQDAAVPPPARAARTAPRPYAFASRYCNDCHARPDRRNALCRMIEGYFWENRDPHRIAMDWGRGGDSKEYGGFRSRAGQRAAEIGGRLKIPDVTRSPQCVGCHSVSVLGGTPRPDAFDPLAEGVTCVACHGADRRWVIEHLAPDDPTWQGLTRRQKWTDYGMVDLWDPVVRARTCMSCHIGDPDPRTGRTITHAMYAAGHPPLPSIEVAAFGEEQPRHWLPLRCKDEATRERLGFHPGRMEQTEQVAASGLVALGRQMELFEAGAGTAEEASTWPEFARFDCYPCHHELGSPGGAARRRTRTARAGRPSAPAWSRALVDLGLEAANPATATARRKELEGLLGRFDRALTDRPFGDPRATSAAARAINEWLRAPLGELSRMAVARPQGAGRILDRHEALRLLRLLSETAGKDLQDYESARQIGWAFRTIERELGEVTANPKDTPSAFNLLATNRGRIREILDGLDGDLVLSMRERGGIRVPDACPPPDRIMMFPRTPDQEPIIGEILRARLTKLADHDPEAVRRRFAELSRLVPAQ